MKSIILTSGPEFSVKNEDGNRKAVKLANEALVQTLKEEIEDYNNLLFICSTPDEYKKNEEYSKLITKSLSLAGLKFSMSDVIDSRNWLFSKGLINSANLVVLLGGDPLEQMEFFNGIELKEKLRKYKGCLLGISAGTVNMAKTVYCSKDEDIEETLYYKGLGLTDINVEPHFDDTDTVRINEVLLKDSEKKSFVALPDESFIVLKDGNVTLNGDAYYFSNGSYNKIDSLNGIYGESK